MKTKQCWTCKQVKPIEEFSPVRLIEPEKRVHHCKPCVAAKCREHYHRTHPNARTKHEIRMNAGKPKYMIKDDKQSLFDNLYDMAIDAFNITVK